MFPFAPCTPIPRIIISPTELVETEDQERLVDLEAQNLRLDEVERPAVDLDEALAGLAVSDCGRGLLLAEALNGLGGGRHDGCRLDVRGESCGGVGGSSLGDKNFAKSELSLESPASQNRPGCSGADDTAPRFCRQCCQLL